MIESYVVTCNLMEIQWCRKKVIDLARTGKCIGYDGAGDTINLHFPTKGDAMMVFLELETFLGTVCIETNPVYINKTNLKGVFDYD